MAVDDTVVGESLVARSVSSPVGELVIVASRSGVRSIDWVESNVDPRLGSARREQVPYEGPTPILDDAQAQLEEYFDGRRRIFDLPLDPKGTTFQLAAWRVLSTIPFGETISYAHQARAMGDVRKARAVGGANGRNPIPIVVPCHRVIGSDGSLTGFAAGTGIKKYLLDFEQQVLGRGLALQARGSAPASCC